MKDQTLEAIEELSKNVDAVGDDLAKNRDEMKVLRRDAVEWGLMAKDTRANMAKNLGKSGAEDCCVEISKIAKAVLSSHRGEKGDVIEKAAALLDISTDARGGYMISDSIADQLDLLALAYGQLLGKVRYVQQEAGVPFHQPVTSTEPASAWVTTEGAAMTEMDLAIGEVVRTPKVLGGWIQISNELLHQPQIDMGAIFADLMVRANTTALETAIIAGDDSGTDPSDGIIVAANVNDGTDLGTATQALLMSFVTESVGTVPSLFDSSSILITSPAAYLSFLTDSLTTPYTSLFDQSGGESKFDRWSVVTSPACLETTHRVIMIDPSKIFVPRWRWAVDVDPYGLFTSNRTRMRALIHCNYGLSYPAGICKTDLTALS